ncbi:hypothetical protein DLAC_01527 [Tieghemostelium lacteum]|uniref:F-box domain-containing protein n=1 Tax=Tieghemostelium lacteum TaxID=361077 RepID=A0A152A5M9_TIELA|nr:hypothetical protein DLAC_01527 [Tieghemostelium lacteum]|eukprot:KYR01534.1 hypothetical protein DLAC_01527 [Tieghemostelium lacteum]
MASFFSLFKSFVGGNSQSEEQILQDQPLTSSGSRKKKLFNSSLPKKKLNSSSNTLKKLNISIGSDDSTGGISRPLNSFITEIDYSGYNREIGIVIDDFDSNTSSSTDDSMSDCDSLSGSGEIFHQYYSSNGSIQFIPKQYNNNNSNNNNNNQHHVIKVKGKSGPKLLSMKSPKYFSSRKQSLSLSESSIHIYQSNDFYFNHFYYILKFPEEIQLKIMSFLRARDLISISSTCKLFNRLSNERTLWRKNCFKNQWKIAKKYHPDFEYKSYFFEKLALSSVNCAKWIAPKFYGSLPSRRFKHTSTLVGKKIIFIGGQETDTKRFNDIIYYDIENQTFSKPQIKGDRVPNFSRHTSGAVGEKIYIFGGFDGQSTNFDLAVFNTANRSWSNIPKEFIGGKSPVSRTNHASAVVGKNVYIFGGNNNDESGRYQVLDDLHCLNTETMVWSQPDVTGDKPCARSGHCMTAIGSKLYLFGGGVWNESDGWVEKFNDIHVFDTDTQHWTKPVVKGDVQTSTFAISFNIGRYLFIFGGGSKPRFCVTNEIYVLDTESMFWSVPSIQEPRPPARDMGTACVADGEVYFMGGFAGGPIDYFNKLKFNFKSLSNLGKLNNDQLVLQYNSGNSYM